MQNPALLHERGSLGVFFFMALDSIAMLMNLHQLMSRSSPCIRRPHNNLPFHYLQLRLALLLWMTSSPSPAIVPCFPVKKFLQLFGRSITWSYCTPNQTYAFMFNHPLVLLLYHWCEVREFVVIALSWHFGTEEIVFLNWFNLLDCSHEVWWDILWFTLVMYIKDL